MSESEATALPVGGLRVKHGLAWLLLLAPLFFLSYGWTNQLAANKGVTANVVFGWETAIPFWPWTIVPYWSIDLFYGLSFLTCRTPREVNHHGLRLLTAQLISITCFVLFPLRFTFEKPQTDGIFGALFESLAAFDLPYNQAPSLHISLLIVIWWALVKRSSPAWRWAWHAWALLVAVSVLTTWQHHFFDLPTGAAVGLMCLWLWPDGAGTPLLGDGAGVGNGQALQRVRRLVLAAAYAAGSLLSLWLAWLGGWAWAMLLGWLAIALALVATSYAWSGVAGFQKRGGRQSLAVRWLLAPYRLGAWINSRAWTRRNPEPSAITPRVWMGRIPSAAESSRLGLDAVLDLTAEFNTPPVAGQVLSLPMLDLVLPPLNVLDDAVEALERAVQSDARKVLVCCALGYGRSALVVAAWLLKSGRAGSVDEAAECIRSARPSVVLGPAQREYLLDWSAHLRAI